MASSSRRDDRVPLIPADCDSIIEAVHNFSTVFESRYGSTGPTWYYGNLADAMREAFEAPGRPIDQRRPFALYVHNDNSIANNIFAQQVLCAESVSAMLSAQFITWGWDVTQQENASKLADWMGRAGLDTTASIVQRAIRNVHDFPLLFIFVKERSSVQMISFSHGSASADEVIAYLLEAIDASATVRRAEIKEAAERAEREAIRGQQEEEYQQSLEQDRQRAESQKQELLAQEELEKTRQKERRRLESLSASLPDEPPAEEQGVRLICVRKLDGSRTERRFSRHSPFSYVLQWIESMGFEPSTHRMLNSDRPPKDVSSLDKSKTLDELKWSNRELLTIEERD